MTKSIDGLLSPFEHGNIRLKNRFVMAPMTRQHSPGGVPGPEVAEYYRKRAAGGVGLIISEGTFIPDETAGWSALVPSAEGAEVAAGWRAVLDAVHQEGVPMYCQLWHQGAVRDELEITRFPETRSVSPSGLGLDGKESGDVLTVDDIRRIVDAYVRAAVFCQEIGFDGIELHGAHGYLFDQFLWERTNRRTDEYRDPLRFPTLVVSSIREAVGADFPIVFRFSQWKTDHYDVKLFSSPDELGAVLVGLRDAGVDMFHPSTRRYWEPAFPEVHSTKTLAGWAKTLTGVPSIIVGSVGLDGVFLDSQNRSGRVSAGVTNLDSLVSLFDEGDFDLVAVGRALLSEPEWVAKHAAGRVDEIAAYEPKFRENLM